MRPARPNVRHSRPLRARARAADVQTKPSRHPGVRVTPRCAAATGQQYNSTLPLREGRIAQQFGEGSCGGENHPSPKNSSLRLSFSTLPQGEGRILSQHAQIRLNVPRSGENRRRMLRGIYVQKASGVRQAVTQNTQSVERRHSSVSTYVFDTSQPGISRPN